MPALSREDLARHVHAHLLAGVDLRQEVADACSDQVARGAELLAASFHSGGKLLICGNGGSAADAQHLAAELMSSLDPARSRPALAAVALTTDTSFLTASANDFGFDGVFERQVQGLGRSPDVLLAISTSGRSTNILRAVRAAKQIGMGTIGFTSMGAPLGDEVDVAVAVRSTDTQLIQECHLALGHALCLVVERLVDGCDRDHR